jgi:transcriptional antiterminator NusG
MNNNTTEPNTLGSASSQKTANTADLKEAQWFAVHVLSGQEHKVKESLLRRIDQEEMRDYLLDVIVPTERVSEVKKSKKVESERRLFPGYVFIHARLLDENNQIIEKTWYYIRETQGILGFADGQRPVPMRKKETEAILSQIKQGEEKVIPKTHFEIGDKVKVGDGPFQNQDGVVEAIDQDRGKLQVSVSIFGRSTLVELEYWQVEKT